MDRKETTKVTIWEPSKGATYGITCRGQQYFISKFLAPEEVVCF